MSAYTPGPGDSPTWPPFSGHQTDPRGPTGWDADAALAHYREEFIQQAADPVGGARFLSDECEDQDMHDLFTRLMRDVAHEYTRPARLAVNAGAAGARAFGLLSMLADAYARKRTAAEKAAMEDDCDD